MPDAGHNRRHIRSYARHKWARQNRQDHLFSFARAKPKALLHKWTSTSAAKLLELVSWQTHRYFRRFSPPVSLKRAVMKKLPLLLLLDRKSTRLNSSHVKISYAVFCLKKKITTE